MSEDVNIPDTVVTDKETAEVGAYAEKPFRDALAEYNSSLDEKVKEALEKIANKEAEAAMKAFEETRSLEDPRIDALRSLVADSTELSWENQRRLEDNKNKEKIAELLKLMGEEILERTLADESVDWHGKTERITNLSFNLNYGVNRALTAISPDEAMKNMSEKFGHGGWSNESLADFFRGYYVTSVINERSIYGVEALVQIARLEGRDPQLVIQEQIPLLNKLRDVDPVNKIYFGGADQSRPRKTLDHALETHGFLRSPTKDSYVYMGEPPKESGGV